MNQNQTDTGTGRRGETAAAVQHTPGPWRITPSLTPSLRGGAYIEAESDRWGQSPGLALVARMYRHRYGSADRVPPDEMQDANARLIAAAPALLAALEAAAGFIHDDHEDCLYCGIYQGGAHDPEATCSAILAAIRKARPDDAPHVDGETGRDDAEYIAQRFPRLA